MEDFKKELLVLCKREIKLHQSEMIRYVRNLSSEILQSGPPLEYIKEKSKKMMHDLDVFMEVG